MTLRHTLILVLLFNLIPLGFVLLGAWRPFDVAAFYWVEVIAVGILAFLQNLFSVPAKFAQGKTGEGISAIGGTLLMPLHYGFFILMMAFMIGGFLPPEEAKVVRKLTGPEVPMQVVMENFDFWLAFAIALVWQGVTFVARRLAPEGEGREQNPPLLHAYGQMFVLFAACFFGMGLGMATDSRLAAAIVLVIFKTAVAVIIARVEYRYEKAAR
jgi:hypothetical protein